ncbi:MAG: 30S ribosomal protein S11 [Candidatus Pacebacteria bacterium]|nr:30S ribosomal protein S11 [Candidatus Paceibacterota bacterium]
MGKKRIIKKTGKTEAGKHTALKSRFLSKGSKRKLDNGILHVCSTYNNTRVSLTDLKGDLICSSSSGALGFKGAKKGTPFAAAKIGELIGDMAKTLGVKTVNVIVKGVGAGRESSIRGFISRGIHIDSIRDMTPIPHNGVRAKKARRV